MTGRAQRERADTSSVFGEMAELGQARLQGARSSQSKRAAAALAPQLTDTLCYPGAAFSH